MLFDLKGKRRRFVQATYLSLAVLMGGGLVLFGIGGGTNGGLLDTIRGKGSRSTSSDNTPTTRPPVPPPAPRQGLRGPPRRLPAPAEGQPAEHLRADRHPQAALRQREHRRELQ